MEMAFEITTALELAVVLKIPSSQASLAPLPPN
jgi:hypothetical protein